MKIILFIRTIGRIISYFYHKKQMKLSEFLKERFKFPYLPDNYREKAELEEEQLFNAWIKKYPMDV